MTPSEARDYVISRIRHLLDYGYSPEDSEAVSLAVKALEKQTPKKPIRKKGVYSESLYLLFCPSCENYVGAWSDMLKAGNMYNHLNRCICPYCGQAIDAEDIR